MDLLLWRDYVRACMAMARLGRKGIYIQVNSLPKDAGQRAEKVILSISVMALYVLPWLSVAIGLAVSAEFASNFKHVT